MIFEFTGEYRFLSNFWSCYVPYEDILYPSVENAYQAAKCAHKDDRKRFLFCKASEAKRLGQLIEMRSDWEDVKVSKMRSLVKEKFSRHLDLAKKLLETGDEELQEGNWWGDKFWGTVNGQGQNMLGKILMSIRTELKG